MEQAMTYAEDMQGKVAERAVAIAQAAEQAMSPKDEQDKLDPVVCH